MAAPRGGITVVFNRLPQLNAAMRHNAERHVAKATLDIEAHIKTSMAEPKSGHTYGSHQASAPGEAPAIDSGTLVATVQSQARALHGVVAIGGEQAEVLEYGGAHVEARPSAQPAAEAVAPGFQRAMRENLL